MRAWPVVLFLLLCVGCGRAPSTVQDTAEWKVRPNAYATHFQLWEQGTKRRVLIFGHGGATDTIGTYSIGERTTPELGERSAHLVGPLDRVALASTTHVPFLAALGVREAIIAVDQAAQVRDSIVSDRIRRKLVADLTSGDGPDRERLLQLRPQALLGDPFQGNALRSIGIPVVGVAEYLEEHPLGRAEWIRVFGVLFGREMEADRLFADIAARYEAAAGKAAAAPDRPLVFFGSTWQGQWFVPSGTSYMARTIADAGGRYAFDDRPSAGNLTVDVETALAVGAQVRYWGTVLAKEGEVLATDVAGGDERILRTPAFRNGGVFAGNSMRADIFGEAVLRPDDVLLDLSGILHPELKGNRAPIYFLPVAQ